MTRPIPNDAPAFPVSIPGCGDNGWHGMSLRDYFAAHYMTAALERAAKTTNSEIERMFPRSHSVTSEQIAAHLAYRYADAMLAARSALNQGAAS